MIEKSEDIVKEIQEWLEDEEKIKTLNRETVDQMIDTWLADFNLVQPSDFFNEHPTNDSELICSI